MAFLDDRFSGYGVERFLFLSFTIPMELGDMSINASRVSIVSADLSGGGGELGSASIVLDTTISSITSVTAGTEAAITLDTTVTATTDLAQTLAGSFEVLDTTIDATTEVDSGLDFDVRVTGDHVDYRVDTAGQYRKVSDD
jgi:hypothetical protein